MNDVPLQAELRNALALEEPFKPADLSLGSSMMELFLETLGSDAIALIKKRHIDQPVIADRIRLGNVLACERFHLEESAIPFAYNISRARTQIAGLILRRWFYRDPRTTVAQEWDPLTIAHEVIDDVFEDDDRLGEFVTTLSVGGRAELAAAALEVVSTLQEAWPSGLTPANFRPNARLVQRLFGGRLRMTYRATFKFGHATRVDGQVLSVVTFLDIRPGREYEEEERFNRWYAAFLELLQTNVSPRRVVTWYGESQRAAPDNIDRELLEAAARRTAGAVRRLVELEEGLREPDLNPGWRCERCTVTLSCETGMRWLQTGANAF